MQACSAVDRALASWIAFVASRHFCLAAATPPELVPEDAVDELEDGEELLELPHALSVVAARTSKMTNGE